MAASPALAQTPAAATAPAATKVVENKTDAGYQVWFDGDQLGAGGIGAEGNIVKGGPHAARMMLMRPRFQFVQEMLKSVEAL